MSKSTKKRTNKKRSRKNTGRGYSLAPLRSTKRNASSTRIRSISQLRAQSQDARTTRKQVRINTPENIIQEYSLGSSEKELKKGTPIRGIRKCNNPKEDEDFPCKMKRTIFRTKKDYNNYKKLKRERNLSTDYRSKSEHYNDIETLLTTQGYEFTRK